MKTSSSQFELMVSFMEQHGDLNTPSSNARGRLLNLQKWEELSQLLNSDGSGDTSCEKWRKVWSDYKNNIKENAARLHRMASRTGNGPAILTKLSDLEQRALNLIGMHVATGLAVDEAGLSQGIHIEVNPNANVASPNISQEREPIPPLACAEEEVEGSELRNEAGQAGPSSQPHITPVISPSIIRPPLSPLIFAIPQVENMNTQTLTQPPQVHVSPLAPALSGQTPCRARRRIRRLTRRHTRPSHSDQASQHFLQAEEYWREFKKEQHKDYMYMKKEQDRIREMEVNVQREWQGVALRALDILDKLANKICRD